ncbi:hypothetical protein QLX67_06210 [Balneolaceae bacterium ANBcel3]|nr:hypothetical protein [Balneolaceae bacterium ANBcel3]
MKKRSFEQFRHPLIQYILEAIMKSHKTRVSPMIWPVVITLLFISACAPGTMQREEITRTEPEIRAWSNFEGIRVNGHLMEFGSSVRLLADHEGLLTCYEPLGDDLALTRGFLNHYAGLEISEGRFHCGRSAKERQRSGFVREGNTQIVDVELQEVNFIQEVEAGERGKAHISVRAEATGEMNLAGAYFTLELPRKTYEKGEVRFSGSDESPVSFSGTTVNPLDEYIRTTATGLHFHSPTEELEVQFHEPVHVIIRGEADFPDHIMVYIPVIEGPVVEGTTGERSFTLRVDGVIDRTPADIVVDTSRPGAVWEGFGGNFRLQSPRDPQVIDFVLENMPLGWGRNEMPWHLWDPDLHTDPRERARAGDIHPRVEAAMEMTQRLYQMGMPTMLAAWWGPDWALDMDAAPGIDPRGLRGTPLDQEYAEQIYESIASYILYLREAYDTEVQYFSFNESDLGIDIRQTPAEHTKLIKELGAYFESVGLPTKVLLGDAADANAFWFIDHAMNDPEARPYMGPVSYHSWRGWDTDILQRWTDAARRMDLPLVIGEGSIDAAGHRYGRFFEESVYALEEINLYTRIMAINQPMTILQWQLTADYSVLAGGGIYGNEEPLRPTVRYWNLLQLAHTPHNLHHMPAGSTHEKVTVAALGDNEEGVYAVHMVNNGAARTAKISGLPDDVTELRFFTTNVHRDMEEGERIPVRNGQAEVPLDAISFVSLMTP